MQVDPVVKAVWFFCALAAVSISDLLTRRIPNVFSILIAAAGLLTTHPAHFAAQMTGALAALPFLAAAILFPDRVGGGDIKFVAAAGLFLGHSSTLWGVIFGLVSAIGYAFLRAGIGKVRKESIAVNQISIPMAPFLSAGFAASYLLKV